MKKRKNLHVWNRVKDYRYKAGLTGYQLSSYVGISYGGLMMVESNKMNPKESEWHKYAEALGVRVSDLFYIKN